MELLADTYKIRRAERSDLLTMARDAADSTTAADQLAWITSHNFQKTTATILDDAGHSARQVADQLGHSRPSITQDVYLGRKVANPAAAKDLESAMPEQEEGESHG